MIMVEGSTLGEVWISAMSIIMEKGEVIYDEDVRLKEICNLHMTINSIRDDDSILAKYADQDRIKLMKEKYATCGLVGDYKVDYGSRIFNNNGVNQLEWAIDRIRNKPETKSATITLHIPGEDKLPCLSLLDFKYRNDMLDMTAVYRSQNIFSSHPGNMLALSQMQWDVAAALGFKVGKVNLIAISAHIYEKDFEKVETILKSIKK